MKYRVSRNLRDVKYIGEKKITADSGTVDEIVEQVNDMFNEYDDTFDDVKKKISTLESNDTTLATKITQTEQSFANQLNNIWPTYRIYDNGADYEIDSDGNAWWIRKFTQSDCDIDISSYNNHYSIYIKLKHSLSGTNISFPSIVRYRADDQHNADNAISISNTNGNITYGNGLIIYDEYISPLEIYYQIDKTTGELIGDSIEYKKTRFSLITFDTGAVNENSKITSLIIKRKIKLPE